MELLNKQTLGIMAAILFSMESVYSTEQAVNLALDIDKDLQREIEDGKLK